MPIPGSADVTIILTLKDRSAFTYRFMSFLNQSPCPCPILVADGGQDQEVGRRLGAAENYPNLRYEYIRYPEDKSYRDYFAKLADVTARVTTPYAMLADNDDFVLPARLVEAGHFLDANPDHVSCGGPNVSFTVFNPSSGSRDDFLRGDDVAVVLPEQNLPLDSASPAERVLHLLRNYYSITWYNVTRAGLLADYFARNKALDFSRQVFMEYLVIAGLHSRGRVTQGLHPHVIRQTHTSDGGDSGYCIEGSDSFLATMLPFWSRDVNALVEALSGDVALLEPGFDREAYDLDLRKALAGLFSGSSSRPRREKSGLLHELRRKDWAVGRAARWLASLVRNATSGKTRALRQQSRKLLAESEDMRQLKEFLRTYDPRRT